MSTLQLKLLEMIKWLDDYLRKNDIKYYILGGTLLGAVRHNGFIPWDDDIDIGIPREDYDKLIEIFKTPIDGYLLESPKTIDNDDYIYQHAKLYDTRTTLIERGKKNIVRGIFIDIFPLDGLGKTKFESRLFFKKISIFNTILAARVLATRKNRKWYKNMLIKIFNLMPENVINNRKLCTKIDSLCARKCYNASKYVGNLCGLYGIKEIIPKTILGTPRQYSFEDIKLFGPEKAEEYLSSIYGDWKKLPPEHKRGIQHDFIKIDFNKSYYKK